VRAQEYLRFDDDQRFHCTTPGWFDKETICFAAQGQQNSSMRFDSRLVTAHREADYLLVLVLCRQT
jgi:hypothetical protein